MELRNDPVLRSQLDLTKGILPDARRVAKAQANLISIGALRLDVESTLNSDAITERDKPKYKNALSELTESLQKLRTDVYEAITEDGRDPVTNTTVSGLAKFSPHALRSLAYLCLEKPELVESLLAEINNPSAEIRKAGLQKLSQMLFTAMDTPETLMRIGDILSEESGYWTLRFAIQNVVDGVRELRRQAVSLIEHNKWHHPLPEIPPYEPPTQPVPPRAEPLNETKHKSSEASPAAPTKAGPEAVVALMETLGEAPRHKATPAEVLSAIETKQHDDFLKRISDLKSRYPKYAELIDARADFSIALFDAPGTVEEIITKIERDIQASMASLKAA